MAQFAIFSRDNGIYMWAGEGETSRDVLVEWHNVLGINPHHLPMDEVAEAFYAYELTDGDRDALTVWDNKASSFPLEGHARLPA